MRPALSTGAGRTFPGRIAAGEPRRRVPALSIASRYERWHLARLSVTLGDNTGTLQCEPRVQPL